MNDAEIWKPWMAHWWREKQPVRFAIRPPGGILMGFVDRASAELFAATIGVQMIYIVKPPE